MRGSHLSLCHLTPVGSHLAHQLAGCAKPHSRGPGLFGSAGRRLLGPAQHPQTVRPQVVSSGQRCGARGTPDGGLGVSSWSAGFRPGGLRLVTCSRTKVRATRPHKPPGSRGWEADCSRWPASGETCHCGAWGWGAGLRLPCLEFRPWWSPRGLG